MRMGDGGFISTVDTIVALEALVTYSYNNRINDITELNVEVELPDSNITENVAVTGKTALGISRLRTIAVREFLIAPSGAQEVTMLVRSFVRSVKTCLKLSIFIFLSQVNLRSVLGLH